MYCVLIISTIMHPASTSVLKVNLSDFKCIWYLIEQLLAESHCLLYCAANHDYSYF